MIIIFHLFLWFLYNFK